MGEKILIYTLLLSTLRFSEKAPKVYRKTDSVIHFMNLMDTISVPNITTLITSVIEIYITKMDNMSFMIITSIFLLDFLHFQIKIHSNNYVSEIGCVSVLRQRGRHSTWFGPLCKASIH